MINTTQDILYLALTIGIVWVIIFLAWIFFYLIMITRDLREISKLSKQKTKELFESISRVRNNTQKITLLATFVSKTFIQFLEYLKSKARKRKKDKKESAK